MLGVRRCIDAIELLSCWDRFIIDPLDETLVNAKAVVRGSRLYIMATTDIEPGDEIFISYGPSYWMDRLDALDPRTRAMVEEEYGRYKAAARRRSKEVVPTPQRSDRTRANEVRTAAEQQEDAKQEKYSFDNVLQSQELAERLQYLVGKRYIDDENGKLYEVAKVWFSRSQEAVVGTRRSLTGHSQAYDDDYFYMCLV
jgi:hypothetical protein